MHVRRPLTRWHWSLLAGLCALAGGCVHTDGYVAPTPPPDGAVPRELTKIVLPPYVIEPPDVLLVQVLVPPTTEEPNPAAGTVANAPATIPITPFSRSPN